MGMALDRKKTLSSKWQRGKKSAAQCSWPRAVKILIIPVNELKYGFSRNRFFPKLSSSCRVTGDFLSGYLQVYRQREVEIVFSVNPLIAVTRIGAMNKRRS